MSIICIKTSLPRENRGNKRPALQNTVSVLKDRLFCFSDHTIANFSINFCIAVCPVTCKENILIYPIGKKISDAVKKQGLKPEGDYKEMADKPAYQDVQSLAKILIDKFINKEIDDVLFQKIQ